MLQLLAGIRGEYGEAFDDRGQLVRPIDIDEAQLLVAELRDVSVRQDDAASLGLPELMDGLQVLVTERVPPVVVETYVEVFRRALIQSTGVREDTLPAARPSLARGRELFAENCAGCHGLGGQGDGPDAKRLGITPRNFTDVSVMRQETPQDAFNVIRLGRQKSGMPAWGEALSPQQVWDLVSYLWSLARTPEAIRDGQRIYDERCVRCHGAGGDPAQSRAANLDRPAKNLAAILDGSARADADLFQAVSAGIPNSSMPPFAPGLTDRDRWAVVAFVRTLSLEGAPSAPNAPLEADHRAEMQDVSRLVDAAIAAHRKRDSAATLLATNAYLRFEPLETLLADKDKAALTAAEQTFVAFRTALRDPAAGNADSLGDQLREELAGLTERLRPVDDAARAGPQMRVE